MNLPAGQRRCLVTGATGYIGARLTGRLLDAGWQVGVLVRRGATGTLAAEWRQAVPLILGPGSGQAGPLVARWQPEVIFHLAALSRIELRPEEVSALVAANLELGIELLEAAARVLTGCRFISTGSFSEFGEAADGLPDSLYGATKQAFRGVLDYYRRRGLIRATTLILFDVYGPGDPRGKILNLLLGARAGATPLAATPGRQRLDFVHVDDVVEAYLAAADLWRMPAEPAPWYLIDSGRRITLRAVAALIEQLGGRPLAIDWGARPYRPGQIMNPIEDGPRLPGWRPRIPIEAGLAKLIGDSALEVQA